MTKELNRDAVANYLVSLHNPSHVWRNSSGGVSHVARMEGMSRDEKKHYILGLALQAEAGCPQSRLDLRETACELMSGDVALDKAEARLIASVEEWEQRQRNVNIARNRVRSSRYNTKHKEFKVMFVQRSVCGLPCNINYKSPKTWDNAGRAWQWAKKIMLKAIDGKLEESDVTLTIGWDESGSIPTMVFSIMPNVNAPSAYNNVDSGVISKLTILEHETQLVRGEVKTKPVQTYTRMKNRFRAGKLSKEDWIEYQSSLTQRDWDHILDAEQAEESWSEDDIEALREDSSGDIPIYANNFQRDEHGHYFTVTVDNISEAFEAALNGEDMAVEFTEMFVEKDDSSGLYELYNLEA